MKPVAVATLVGLLGAAVGSGASLLVTQTGLESSPRFAQLDADVSRLVQLVESEAAQRTALLERVDELQRQVATRSSGEGGAVALSEIDAAVERALAARLADHEAELAAVDEEGARTDGYDAGHYFARLGDPELAQYDREVLWQQIREAGLTDEVVEMFEELAKSDPSNPGLQVALGVAYLEKTQELGQSALAGVYAGKADEAFDAALALDDTNWDARFTKAVALSFWPPIFGKQSEAVKHFETLIEQQQIYPGNSSQYAQSYLLLGNLYSQMGQADKALDTWTNGLELHPDDSSLLDQVASVR